MEKYLEDGLWKIEFPYVDKEFKDIIDLRCTQVWVDSEFVTLYFIDRNDDRILKLAELLRNSSNPSVVYLKVYNRERKVINNLDWLLEFERYTCTEVEGRRRGFEEFSNYITMVFKK